MRSPGNLNKSRDRSILESEDFDFAKFIKKFDELGIGDSSSNASKLSGCKEAIACIRRKVDNLLDSKRDKHIHALITGPPETGKTFVVHEISKSYSKKRLNYMYLDSRWTLERQFGNPEERLRQIFESAIENEPSLLFIDRLDAICEKKRYQNDTGRIFNALEGRLESLRRRPALRVLVLAATNRPEVLDPQIKLHFKQEICFTLPTLSDRGDKLREVIGRINANLSPLPSKDIEKLAAATHSYSYDDIEVLCYGASEQNPTEPLSYEHFQRALRDFKPVQLKSVTTPCPPVRWEDIGGVASVKMDLQVSVIWPLKHSEKFKRLGFVPKGVLLYGPPGCSKTMLARALATESGYNFISIKGPQLLSKYVGESEAEVRNLYRNARAIAPCIIFFDEIDALAREQSGDSESSVGERVAAQLLTELDGVEPLDNVFTIAATNRPGRISSTLLRPGRLDPAIYVPLPSRDERVEIFLIHLRKQLKLSKDLDRTAELLADETDEYSGADIARVCRVAGELAAREDPDCDDFEIEWRHFELSLEKVKPSTRPAQMKSLAKFREANQGLFTEDNSEPQANKVAVKTRARPRIVKVLTQIWSRSPDNPGRSPI